MYFISTLHNYFARNQQEAKNFKLRNIVSQILKFSVSAFLGDK